jgi:trehalose 6-phosphate synthase
MLPMRITLRLIVSLLVAVSATVFLFASYQVHEERTRLVEDLDRRAALRNEELADNVLAAFQGSAAEKLRVFLAGIRHRDRLVGIAVYDLRGDLVAASPGLAERLPAGLPLVSAAAEAESDVDEDLEFDGAPYRVHAHPLYLDKAFLGTLVILHDAAFVGHQVASVWKRNALRLGVQALLITAVTLLVVRWTILRPMGRLADWVRHLRTGPGTGTVSSPPSGAFPSLTVEVASLASGYRAARAAAEEEARLRASAEAIWTPDRLKEHARARLQGRPLVVVSNREPCMHVRENREVRCLVPASGLVTALEPILRACSGTWIAHGAGNADREFVDDHGRLRVPPDDPTYVLRRVWMTPEEEEGYYYGFSNEGLWPLCHIAHTRPLFRPGDWEMYRKVNERFRDVVLEEIQGTQEPCVLIQDYHFALLPRLVKSRRPDAHVAIFWHIPWPNPEAFGICPWQREILDGMLGADLIGFHIQYHCNNFLETVDRALEARIEWEQFAVNRQDHVTYVKPFPISVAFTGGNGGAPSEAEKAANKAQVCKELGFEVRHVGTGVDRVDYTKGILERFRSVERFLEKHPAYQGQFTFVQVGAPSRTRIPRYRDFNQEVIAEAERINARFRTASAWKPIVLRLRHHSHAEIEPFFRASDVCLVTSLHDGMNLVAKEFVVSRADEQGVLVLSQFAGASRILPDALIVNPYDVDQTAEAIRQALDMAPDERRERMRRLRAVVRERNVYRWAAELIDELSRIRVAAAGAGANGSPQPDAGPVPPGAGANAGGGA